MTLTSRLHVCTHPKSAEGYVTSHPGAIVIHADCQSLWSLLVASWGTKSSSPKASRVLSRARRNANHSYGAMSAWHLECWAIGLHFTIPEPGSKSYYLHGAIYFLDGAIYFRFLFLECIPRRSPLCLRISPGKTIPSVICCMLRVKKLGWDMCWIQLS